MLYDIALKIDYTYENISGHTRQIVRLMPANLEREQRLIAGTLKITPTPNEQIQRYDFFGNQCVELAFLKPHKQLGFSVKARIERSAQVAQTSTPLSAHGLSQELKRYRSLDGQSPLHFMGSSLRASLAAQTTHYAQTQIDKDMTVIECVAAIGSAIHRDFKFDPHATTVETPMLEAFEGRHGVCQDFTHIMIACLRGIGIPAAYVSGFLRTEPPKGKPRLEGADAMHAWVAAWCGQSLGWVEYDPTNHVFVGQDHIVIARGRDYFDVAPVKGISRTFGKHKTKQAVDVIPVA